MRKERGQKERKKEKKERKKTGITEARKRQIAVIKKEGGKRKKERKKKYQQKKDGRKRAEETRVCMCVRETERERLASPAAWFWHALSNHSWVLVEPVNTTPQGHSSSYSLPVNTHYSFTQTSTLSATLLLTHSLM